LRRSLPQRAQDRAPTTFAAWAAGNGSLQFTGYSAQFTHPLLDVGEVMPGQLIDVVAGHRDRTFSEPTDEWPPRGSGARAPACPSSDARARGRGNLET